MKVSCIHKLNFGIQLSDNGFLKKIIFSDEIQFHLTDFLINKIVAFGDPKTQNWRISCVSSTDHGLVQNLDSRIDSTLLFWKWECCYNGARFGQMTSNFSCHGVAIFSVFFNTLGSRYDTGQESPARLNQNSDRFSESTSSSWSKSKAPAQQSWAQQWLHISLQYNINDMGVQDMWFQKDSATYYSTNETT